MIAHWSDICVRWILRMPQISIGIFFWNWSKWSNFHVAALFVVRIYAEAQTATQLFYDILVFSLIQSYELRILCFSQKMYGLLLMMENQIFLMSANSMWINVYFLCVFYRFFHEPQTNIYKRIASSSSKYLLAICCVKYCILNPWQRSDDIRSV